VEVTRFQPSAITTSPPGHQRAKRPAVAAVHALARQFYGPAQEFGIGFDGR
jgi:hypothetical protein